VLRPLRLEIRHYETVVAIVNCGTMTEAALHLSITQSAASHRLAEAERRLGLALFSRGPDRRLSPTTHGARLYEVATRTIADLARLEESLVGSPDRIKATVRIGVGGYAVFDWYPSFQVRTRSKRPELTLELIALDDDPASALASRSVDVVLAPGQLSGDHINLQAISDELVLLCAANHPMAALEAIDAPNLIDETYLTYNGVPSPGFEYDRFVRPSGVFPRSVRVVRHPDAIVELVAAGTGVSILSRWATRPAVADGRVAAVRCGSGGLPIAWHVTHRRNDELAAGIATALARHTGSWPDKIRTD